MKELLLLLTLPWSVTMAASVEKRDDLATTDVDLLMPHVHPVIVDSYLCHSMKMPTYPLYLVGFEPKASMEKVHHILIYGCSVPGNAHSVWDCGEMHTNSQSFETAPVCGNNGAKIIYAWGLDAPVLRLPPGVAFKVGDDTDIQYLVLQVHYKDVTPFLPPRNETDNSGVSLMTTDIPQPKRAGVYLMGTGGKLPAHSTTYFETACSYNEPYVMHPFAYRTHAHTHGRVNAGYRVRNGEWAEIGRMSPRKPQMFYNVTHPGMTVRNGDILAARCTMISDEANDIKIGATSKDEMCNFYVMYYVNGDHALSEDYCFTPGPPSWHWTDFPGLEQSPAPLSASIIPGSKDFIEASDKALDRIEETMERQHERMNGYMERLMDALSERRGGYEPEEEEEPIDNVIGNGLYDRYE